MKKSFLLILFFLNVIFFYGDPLKEFFIESGVMQYYWGGNSFYKMDSRDKIDKKSEIKKVEQDFTFRIIHDNDGLQPVAFKFSVIFNSDFEVKKVQSCYFKSKFGEIAPVDLKMMFVEIPEKRIRYEGVFSPEDFKKIVAAGSLSFCLVLADGELFELNHQEIFLKEAKNIRTLVEF